MEFYEGGSGFERWEYLVSLTYTKPKGFSLGQSRSQIESEYGSPYEQCVRSDGAVQWLYFIDAGSELGNDSFAVVMKDGSVIAVSLMPFTD